jgi:uncharacterized protein YjcR
MFLVVFIIFTQAVKVQQRKYDTYWKYNNLLSYNMTQNRRKLKNYCGTQMERHGRIHRQRSR